MEKGERTMELTETNKIPDQESDNFIGNWELIETTVPQQMKIKLLHDDAVLPKKAHISDAGYDLVAIEDIRISNTSTSLVKTGISIQLSPGYEAQIRPRSGMSLKTKFRIPNAPGTIDSGYRGEICVIMENTDRQPQWIRKGDRIAQMVICKLPNVKLVVSELDDSDRGDSGFGSSGT